MDVVNVVAAIVLLVFHVFCTVTTNKGNRQ